MGLRLAPLFFLAAMVGSPVFVFFTLSAADDPSRIAPKKGLVHREGGYVGSATCAACHPEHHQSWHRTYHRTMTQLPTEGIVRGDFSGQEVRFGTQYARPFRGDSGSFWMDVPDGESHRRAEVALAVGSRRYQQYFEKVDRDGGSQFRRLPVLWHIEAKRWMHLNAVFLEPDDLDATGEFNPQWDRHAAVWNQNCIFCHNTGARPSVKDYATAHADDALAFDSKVAELGISCEACHGPGLAHAEHHRPPLTRYQARRDDRRDPYVTDPHHLDRDRSDAVCGQCHGQRLPKPIENIAVMLATGPTFRPGDRLEDHVTPVSPELATFGTGATDMFRNRFWRDGTPRLTAYELQGMRLSPCHERGSLTCGSCHTMHDGDPRGMLPAAMKGNAACTQCHQDIAEDVSRHTGHAPESNGSSCLECHMPPMVFGILGIHRSHRIENPDPKRDGENGRPHACTLCHVDRSLTWSASEMTRIFGKTFSPPNQRRDGAPLDLPDAIASLAAGDAVQRAVYAEVLGRPDRAIEDQDTAELRRALIVTLGDAYPGIRWLAMKSLLAVDARLPIGLTETLGNLDPTEGAGAPRRERISELLLVLNRDGPRRLKRAPKIPVSQFIDLMRLQSREVLSIGE